MLLCSVLYVVVFDVAHEQTRAMPRCRARERQTALGPSVGGNHENLGPHLTAIGTLALALALDVFEI